jgi:hypothetical protein
MFFSIRIISLVSVAMVALSGCTLNTEAVPQSPSHDAGLTLPTGATTTVYTNPPQTNPCDSNPCLAGYTCENHGDFAVCVQNTVKIGADAGPVPTPTKPCDSNPCLTGSTCENHGEFAICVQNAPKIDADASPTLIPANPCDSNPCLTGFTCENHGDIAVCVQNAVKNEAGAAPIPANPCDSNPCPTGYICENWSDVAVCVRNTPKIEADAGSAPVPVDPCKSKVCGVAQHCAIVSANAYCVADDAPISIDCPLPPEPADVRTSTVITKQRFLLPEDGTYHNNAYVGPFCCTGHTAEIKNAAGTNLAYAYFFSWESQAYNIGETSYVSDVTILIAGVVKPVPDAALIKDAIRFTAEEIASCTSHRVNVGTFTMTATPRHVDVWRPYCLGWNLGFDMATLTFAIDVKYVDRN